MSAAGSGLSSVPMQRAASTYSLFLIERICPRIRRAILTQYSNPNTINMEIIFVPSFSRTRSLNERL